MNYITLNEEFVAVIVIPESQSGDTVTYSIVKASDGSEFDSGNATHISGELWKVTFTPDALDTFIVVLTDSTLDSKREEIYKAVGADVDTPVAPSGNDLTTLANVKTAFSITTSQHDTQLTRLVTQMSNWAQKYCQRNFNAQDYTEYYDGDGDDFLLVKHYPINSVASLYDDLDREYNADDLIDSDDIIIRGDERCFGEVALDSGLIFHDGRKNIKITYNAGFSTVPGDLEYAVQCLVMAAYMENNGSINEVVSDQIIYKPDKLRKQAMQVLDRYRTLNA